mmetsp:Transcript_29160/g.72674  ORF Transcript_29160/g.72674 Transcript_29160/m.72674 type:complete len:92 (-) Transcript_29160:602-877(-)
MLHAERYPTPKVANIPVDWCGQALLDIGFDCGQDAADAFCRYWTGFNEAVPGSFARLPDCQRTIRIIDLSICTAIPLIRGCSCFAYIDCQN